MVNARNSYIFGLIASLRKKKIKSTIGAVGYLNDVTTVTNTFQNQGKFVDNLMFKRSKYVLCVYCH